MYRLDNEQTRIVAQVAAVAEQSIAPHAQRVDKDRAFPKESVAALGKAGLLGLTVPSAFGGLGQNLRTMAAALEEVSQRCSSTAMVYLMHLCGVACLRGGAREDRVATCGPPPAASTSARWPSASAGSRSHFWAPVSRAVAANGGMQPQCTEVVCDVGRPCRTAMWSRRSPPNATQPVESTIYLVLARRFRASACPVRGRASGMRGNASAPMTLDDVTVGDDRALTAPGKGLDLMLGVVLPAFQVGSAAVALGIAEAAVQATTQHLTTDAIRAPEQLARRAADAARAPGANADRDRPRAGAPR